MFPRLWLTESVVLPPPGSKPLGTMTARHPFAMLRSPAIKIHIKGLVVVRVLHAQQMQIAIIFRILPVRLVGSASFLLGLRAQQTISAPLKTAQLMFVQVCK